MAHEVRLNLRAIQSARPGRSGLRVILGITGLVSAVMGGILAFSLTRSPMREAPLLNAALDCALLMVLSLQLSQTLSAAITAFFERGDLDLLLSSPLLPHRVFAARALGVATVPFLWFGALASFLLIPLALFGDPRWLAVYPVLIGLSLVSGAAGIGLALALFRLLGARRTRTVGQLFAGVLGAAIFLLSQIPNAMPAHGAALLTRLRRWTESGAFAPGAPLSWPAEAMMGRPAPLIGWVLGCGLVFLLAARAFGRPFTRNAAVAAGAPPDRVRMPSPAAMRRGFGGGVFAHLVRKERRLLVRDPTLLSQVLLRALYLLPLGFSLFRALGHGQDAQDLARLRLAAIAGVMAGIAAQLAGSLIWITLSGEDAPDLLACAPVAGSRLRQAKLFAALTPLLVLLAAPLIAMALLSPWVGLCALLGATAAAVSASLINLWFERPAPRRSFLNRGGGSTLVGVSEIMLSMIWGLATGLAAAGSPGAFIPLAMALMAMGALFRGARPRRAG
jgi:ABC-2 type transport system permease protein